MRMWMTKPEIMCRQHLIGEYRELFTFIGTLKRKISIKGYIDNDLLEPLSLLQRYIVLKNEMIKRGYHPKKELVFDISMLNHLSDEHKNHKINIKNSETILLTKCKECRRLQDGS
jgi:hypothetical protein